MTRTFTIITLILVYAIFGILLNSVGIVISQSMQYFDVSKSQASVLEGFKDLPIAVVSFFVAAQLGRFGYKRGLIFGVTLILIGCLCMLFIDDFWAAKVHFLCVGVAFGLAKVAVYSSVGVLTNSKQEHASLLTTIEGFFVLGIMSMFWIYSFFINAQNAADPSWLNVYWLLVGMCIIVLIMLFAMKLDEGEATQNQPTSVIQSYIDMIKIGTRPLIIVMVIALFFYVVIEQGINTWLPQFNREVLLLNAKMSVQAASIFALSSAIGRLVGGILLRSIPWYVYLTICLIGMAALVLLTLPMTHSIVPQENLNWFNAPKVMYLFPLIGFFMGPIYPVVSSVVLSSLPKYEQSSAIGLLVVGSALGGTLGSLIVGRVFEHFNGQTAFYLTLIPIAIVFGVLTLLRNLSKKLTLTAMK